MKLTSFFAATLVASSAVVPVAAPAAAQRTVVTERTVVRHQTRYNRPHRVRRVCNWRYRDHRRIRVCRTVRY